MHPFRRLVRRDDCLDDEESLRAYSGDASTLSARPAVVLRPRDKEELRRILVRAARLRFPVVPRGTGTGVRGGVVLRDACILHLHHFKRISRIDTQLRTVDVEAGVSIEELNAVLAPRGLMFPLTPENTLSSVGGLAAIDAVTLESFRFGSFAERVEWVEAFDGSGRLAVLKAARAREVLGWEGATGIITKLRLRLERLAPIHSLEIVALRKDADIERLVSRFSAAVGVELLDAHCARTVGLPPQAHLVAAFTDFQGSYQNPERVASLLQRVRLVGANLPLPEDVQVDERSLFGSLALARRMGVPVHGHVGIGVLIAHPVRSMRKRFLSEVLGVGARPGGKFGYGRLNREFAPFQRKKELVRLKEKRDCWGILNPGVLSSPTRG